MTMAMAMAMARLLIMETCWLVWLVGMIGMIWLWSVTKLVGYYNLGQV